MFKKILIANRGEIACRVMATARRMGIATVAVYSEADTAARHVALADEAHLIGPPRASQSYLKFEAILEAVARSGAGAVHPGYGFLSENAGFAEAVAAAGAVFIGPPTAAIRAMGDKATAKALMAEAKVPLVPGYHGADQDTAALARAAEAIGYPVLVKASAGGGGRGMRVVTEPGALESALASARRESKAAFGADRLLIEKYLDRPRHIELQVFADSHGHIIHLYERDCSIQRRHQKVIEEAPAPGMTEELRAEMGKAAVAVAQAVDYVGAGTVEFLVDREGAFYFMEMNTRLQVEHPVTEMIVGEDLVEWQLRVAAGEPLPVRQDDVEALGHAIEARVYAEDPARGFLPSAGRLTHLRFPKDSVHLRIDSGVLEGDEVSVHYDPMIAKLVVWDEDRPSALRRLRAALGESQVVGLSTNLDFLSAIAAHPAFAAGELETGFVDRHRCELFPEPGPLPDLALAFAAVRLLLDQAAAAERAARASTDPHSYWHRTDGWCLNDEGRQVIHLAPVGEGAVVIPVTVHYRAGSCVLDLPGGSVMARGEIGPEGEVLADLGGTRLRASVIRRSDELTVIHGGHTHHLALADPLARTAGIEAGTGHLAAPMPGKILAVLVEEGARVRRGAALMVVEAMKMEHTIAAPTDGTVSRINFSPGDQVDEGAELLVIDDGEGV
jgi:3-methylcrotonyl-CoA carboxylase alpha subunit